VMIAGMTLPFIQTGSLLPPVAWVALLLVAYGLSILGSRADPGWNLFAIWALVGLVAPYFPALFQRKLMMGLAIPWAVLAAAGLSLLIRKQDRSMRNLLATLIVLIASASSLRWFQRELVLIHMNVSNTTVHPVYLGADAAQIVKYLNENKEARTVVLAPPGVPSPGASPDQFDAPFLPDLNPILSGLTGVYTFASHWSETPDYAAKRATLLGANSSGQLMGFYSQNATAEQRHELVKYVGVDYVVAPIPESFPALPLADLRSMGQVVVEGYRFDLIKLPR